MINQESFPILEYDSAPEGLLEPSRLIERMDIPEQGVLCFFKEVVESVVASHEGRVIHNLKSEMGVHPVYEINVDGKRLALMHSGVGAPLAAGMLEELIALGVSQFVAAGGAGVIIPELGVGHVVVPTHAVRDEGTSYHYLPPSRDVAASEKAVAAIEATLKEDNVSYVLGKTWTTDAIYRETPDKIQMRKAEGCITVEMEAAAFFAVAQFRGVDFGQMLYSGDDVSGDTWDSRHWNSRTSIREKLFWLAAEAVLRM